MMATPILRKKGFTGLKVYFWLWEHLRDQVWIFWRTAKILGAQLKILGAPQLQVVGPPTPEDQKNTLRSKKRQA